VGGEKSEKRRKREREMAVFGLARASWRARALVSLAGPRSGPLSSVLEVPWRRTAGVGRPAFLFAGPGSAFLVFI